MLTNYPICYQALTASELIHLLKADVLQSVTDEQNGEEASKAETGGPEPEPLDADQSQADSDLDKSKSDQSESEVNPTESEQSSLEENTSGEQ